MSSEAKGGVGNSYDLRHISDRRILHRAIDSERENSTLKPFNAAAKPKTAKTLNFLVRSSAPRGSSLRNLKAFAPHSRETVIARCFPSAAPPQAPPRPSFRQRAITAVCSESLTRWQPSAWIVSLFYGSVRAVKVLLASLRSTLTPTPSAGKRSLGFHAKKFVAAENEANGSVPRTKLLQLLTKMSRSFILQDAILDRRWIRGLVLAQIRAQSMISQQEPRLDWRQTRQTYTCRHVSLLLHKTSQPTEFVEQLTLKSIVHRR